MEHEVGLDHNKQEIGLCTPQGAWTLHCNGSFQEEEELALRSMLKHEEGVLLATVAWALQWRELSGG